MLSRRAFLKSLGLALASAALASCERQKPTLTPTPNPTSTPAPTPTPNPTPTPAPTPTPTPAPRVRIRQAWLDLVKLPDAARKDLESGQAMLERLGNEHRAALDELVAAGEIAGTVAADVQAAFEDVAYHVWRSNAPITCYLPVIVDYKPATAEDLRRRAELLADLAEQGKLQPETVARVVASVERDVAYLALSDADEQALLAPLIEARLAGTPVPVGGTPDLPISPDVAEAARFLAELLAQKTK